MERLKVLDGRGHFLTIKLNILGRKALYRDKAIEFKKVNFRSFLIWYLNQETAFRFCQLYFYNACSVSGSR